MKPCVNQKHTRGTCLYESRAEKVLQCYNIVTIEIVRSMCRVQEVFQNMVSISGEEVDCQER